MSKKTKKQDDFVHLHLHSDLSQLDGCGKISEYVKKAKSRNNPAIALTDHGTMRGYMTQYEECKALDIKPIYGLEFYVSPDMRRKGLTEEEKKDVGKGLKKMEARKAIKDYEEREGIRDRWHLTVWAKDNVGLRNLFRLSSLAFIEGFYYKPRIDIKELIKYGDGLLVSTGCLSSPINDCWVAGRKRYAFDFADQLQEVFGERLWLEIQPHAIADQRVANRLMLKLHKRYGGVNKLLATQDAHYVKRSDAPHHEVLLCIGTNDVMSNADRFKFDGDEFHMRNRKAMRDAFQRHHEFIPSQLLKKSLDATLEFAEQVDVKLNIDYHRALLPDPGIPEKFKGDHFKYLKELCIDGWTWRQIPRRAREYAAKHGVSESEAFALYKERLKYELTALKRQNFVLYFIIIHDLYEWARGESIMVGPGRGSVAGCLIGYLIGITAVDPIEHGLIFERFINPNRIDMPDCDMDFEDRRRGEVMDYIRQKYGEENVCQIATIGKLSGKQCLKDVSRVLEVPYAEVNAVTNSILERSSGDERASATIEDSFKEFEVCKKFNEKYPAVLHHARHLEGMAKSLGIHAAGIVASPVPLTDVIPLEIRKHNGKNVVVSAADMYGVAANGLVKLDVLGLRTLTVLKETTEAVKERHGVDIDLESEQINLNDPKVLQGFTDHDYGGVFQYDTPSADKVCTGVTFDSFEDIAAMTALNRPGTSRSGLASRYVERKKNPKLVKKIDYHPAVSEITKDTLGIIVYQEHVIKIFTDIAGFAPGTADSLRKTIAKKIGDETMGKERANFVAGAVKKTGMKPEVANKIMDAITFFGCLPRECVVATPTGERSIADLKISDDIYSWLDGKIVKNRVKRHSSSGQKKLLEITFKDGSKQRCSEDHWWLTSDGWRKAACLRLGERLLCVHAEALHQARANQRPYSGQADRFNASRLSNRERQTQDHIHRGEGCSGQMENAASRYHGDTYRSEARTQRDCTSQGRGWNEQRNKQSGVDESQSTHDVAQTSIQGAAVSGAELREASFLPSHVHGSLSSVVQSEAHRGRLSGRLREDRRGRRQYAKSNQQHPPGFAEVQSITPVGTEETWDIECECEPHNYVLSSGNICHNSYGFNKSHATAYSMIAFWCMYLKIYYPLEFYWALLKNEPDRIRIQQYAKGAKKKNIEFLSPSVSTSKAAFSIDAEGKAIRGSLVDIKGVGDKAAEAVIDTQPYTDFNDFLARVDRRRVHKGVVLSLARAGALDELLPNPRWLVENIEAFWKQLARKSAEAQEEAQRMLRESADAPRWDDEERQLVASQVSPLAFGKHPMDAYGDFISKTILIDIVPMSDDGFFKRFNNKSVLIGGVIVEVKLNQIGDFHTGRLPSEESRERMMWGKRYANVNVEDVGGKQNRIKFDWDVYPRMRPIIELGLGSPVLVMASVNGKFENLRAFFAVDLEGMRQKIKADKPLDIWERIVTGDHPVKHIPASSRKIIRSRWINRDYRSGKRGKFWGVVTNVRIKFDKRGQEMAFFGLIGGDGYMIDVVCFGSQWIYVKHVISPGVLLKIELSKERDDHRGVSHFFNGGLVKRFKIRDPARR